MSPDSSPEPDRFFTVQDARKLVEHFSPELPISDDKIRRYCREGKIAGHQVDKRWVMTLGALFQAELVPLEALDAYGEVLDIPDNVPEEWAAPLAPHEPGPLERMLAADAAAQAAADQHALLEQPLEPSEPSLVEDNSAADVPETDRTPDGPHDDDTNDTLAWVVDDEDDEDLAPERPVAPGVASDDAPSVVVGPRPRHNAADQRRRRRAAVVAVPLVVLLAGAGIVATSGDRSSPAQAQAQPSAATVQLAAEQREREQRIALRTAMDVAAERGDYRAAIDGAEQLGDATAAGGFRAAAASTLVKRARTAAERGDLDRARGLVHQSRRYADTDGAKRVDRRIDEIERARRARAAKRKRDAARRAAARRATPSRSTSVPASPARTAPGPSAPSTSAPVPTPSSPSPRPSATPAPSSGGSSGGGSGRKPSSNNEFDYLGG